MNKLIKSLEERGFKLGHAADLLRKYKDSDWSVTVEIGDPAECFIKVPGWEEIIIRSYAYF